MEQHRTHAMPRVEHPVDRDVSLAQEELVAFHLGAYRNAVQLAVVVETRVVRVDDVRHTIDPVGGHRSIASPNAEQFGFSHIDGSPGTSGGSALTPHAGQIGETSSSSVSSHRSRIGSVSLCCPGIVRLISDNPDARPTSSLQ